MTAPMIGNYGVNPADPESASPQIAGVVVRELSRTYSNWRAEGDLESYLEAAQIPILEGVDTRRLTRHLRTVGVMRGVIGAGRVADRRGARRARGVPVDGGARPRVTRDARRARYEWGNPQAPHHIVAYDFGIKRNILRLFDDAGLPRHGRARLDAGRSCARDDARRGVPVERPGRSGRRSSMRPSTIRTLAEREVPDLRYLPGTSALGAHVRREHRQDAVRPPGRKSPGARASRPAGS